MPQDYIVRLLEQLRAIAATVGGKKAADDLAGAEQEIEEQCVRQTGLPFAVVKQATPEGLSLLLGMGGAMQLPRRLILAELLSQDGDLNERRGDPPLAALSYRQAIRLIDDALPSLRGAEAAAIRKKQAAMAAKLRDIG